MKILNILAVGGVGGIETLCYNIIKNSKENHSMCCLFQEGDIYDTMKEEGINIFSTVKYKKNIFHIIKILEKYCIDQKIDVVIVHHGGVKCDIVFLMLQRKLKKVKFIRYLHGCFDNFAFGNDGSFIKRILVKKMLGKVLKRSDLNIYISKAAKKSFKNKFNIHDDSKNIVIYNGISKRFFSAIKEKGNNKNIYISYIGRLEKVKGVDILIDAFSDIVKEKDNVELIITGDGTERKRLENRVKDLKIQNHVDFLGKKENVIPILDKTNIFIYPSLWEEGLGISVIEAMARGCIPIVFNRGGLPELVEDNVNGKITKDNNKEELEKNIKEILDMKKEQREEMSKKAREKAESFKLEKTISELEKVIRNLY